MWTVLTKTFVRTFYSANAGFFLFFFFIFFGVVEGSSLISYHFSLMNGMLRSAGVLLLVFCCWLLYHLKCSGFFLRLINSEEGTFLYQLQMLPPFRLWLIVLLLYSAVYAPVIVYAVLVIAVGWQHGHTLSGTAILFFLVLSLPLFTSIIYYRLTHWLQHFQLPIPRWSLWKTYLFYTAFHFTHHRKIFLLALKAFSLFLLYLILVWNKGRYDNDSFLLFYLVILLAHAAVPYFAVQFWEEQFSVYRNLPVSLFNRNLAFLIPYCFIVLPDVIYLFLFGEALPPAHKLAYSINLPVSLFLLTTIQYSEAGSRDEYIKASFALVFVSLFFLHVQAFWIWIAVQMSIATLLFANGYYRYERTEEM